MRRESLVRRKVGFMTDFEDAGLGSFVYRYGYGLQS